MKPKYQALVVSLILISGLLFTAGIIGGHLEAYCFFWPRIDTRYASGYSERAFKRVKIGMAYSQVVELLGEPLFKRKVSRSRVASDERSGDEVWSYTSDGAAPWGDWAWLSREVVLRDGSVVQRVSRTYFD